MKNKGKLFEQDIQASAKSQGIFILRLNDSSLSWQHEKTARFTAENMCDFIVYKKPILCPIECKSTCYKSMSIQRDPEDKSSKMIKLHQIQSLVNASLADGCYPGLLLNFRNDEDINDNITYWLPIQGLSDFLVESDKGSINKLDCIQHGAYIVDQKLKRTHYTYDIEKLLNDIQKFAEGREE